MRRSLAPYQRDNTLTWERTIPPEGHVAEVQWDSLWRVDSHKGYIRLGPDRRVFAVAMFHELHCVGSLRRALTNPSHPDSASHHVHHCFNYLRQFFLCSADSTLEPYDFMTRDYTAERVGITRKCRDWSAILEAAQQNFIDWRPWFIRNLTSTLQGNSGELRIAAR
ncbi:unnamed protein product [Somion occarium]|uniref:Uncharacterized protein n=1 Tax=Somion occarium TaxID=3059160 RepID=A0ABP1CNE1_9APHY